MKRRSIAGAVLSGAMLASLGAVVTAAPAEAATNVRLVNHTNGNVYYRNGLNGTRHRIDPGHTSAVINRYTLYLMVYSTNPYGYKALGASGSPTCMVPGSHTIPTGASDGAANQFVLDDSRCR